MTKSPEVARRRAVRPAAAVRRLLWRGRGGGPWRVKGERAERVRASAEAVLCGAVGGW
ncbi:hypothetical protein [Halococcus hamelinensis]|uniref:hypothetical protein n=1 Tax=Halococcus hamelinensis TaxID=332168 RepID=UPI00135F1175|nr:hypothetical protein [Halococcus hamelinensis]